MQFITEIAIQKALRGVFTRAEASCWIDADGARLDALLKRAVAADEIWRIRRGLFCLAGRYTPRNPNPLELAQRVHGPSYISFESTLSYHGWIPESVQAITSATLERSRTFDTPIGLFSFTRVPQAPFYAGVSRLSVDQGASFFMANPLKALADYVYTHRRAWTSAAPLVESLRVDDEDLARLTGDAFDTLLSAYTSELLTMAARGLTRGAIRRTVSPN